MDLRTQLATRFHIENIRELLHYIKEDERLREEIYRLIFDEDDVISYQALWVCTHFSKPEVEWLTLKQDELIDAALTCPHSGKRRMLLNLLCQQQQLTLHEWTYWISVWNEWYQGKNRQECSLFASNLPIN